MRYRGHHRQVTNRRPWRRSMLTVAAVTGSVLVAPLAVSGPIASDAAVRSPVLSFTDYDRAPWLTAPDIAVNPQGVAPGGVAAPAVQRGYVITGDHLHRFEVTGTPQAAAELRALVERIGVDGDGHALDTTGYRVFTTPPIIDVQYVEAMKHVMTLVGAVQAVIDLATDPALVQDLTDALYKQAPAIQHDDPTTAVQTVAGLVGFVTDPAFLQGVQAVLAEQVRRIQDEGVGLPPGTLDTVLGIATTAIDLITSLSPDPAVLMALAAAVLARLGDGSLPININDDPESILGDITHLAPVGTDVVGVDDTLSDQGLAEVFILPVGVGVGEIGAAWDDGRVKVTAVLNETPTAPVTGVVQQQPSIEPQWDTQGRQCVSRKSNNTAWYDPCYEYATLAKDGDPNRVAWTHHQKGTGKSKGVWRLLKLTVESNRRIHTPDQQWQDWSPDRDISMDCDNYRLQVGVSGVAWSKDVGMCDEWLIHKDSPAVNWKVRWDGNAWRRARNVAGMKTFSVPNGFRPDNVTRYDYEAW